MKKLINWVNEFVETQKEEKALLRVNKLYLRENSLFKTFKIHDRNFMNIEKDVNDIVEILNKIDEDIQYLDKKLSTQKGRITKQTNEQNKENEANNSAFSNIFERLDKLEKKAFIKSSGKKCEHKFEEVGRSYENDFLIIYQKCFKCGEEFNLSGKKEDVLKILGENK